MLHLDYCRFDKLLPLHRLYLDSYFLSHVGIILHVWILNFITFPKRFLAQAVNLGKRGIERWILINFGFLRDNFPFPRIMNLLLLHLMVLIFILFLYLYLCCFIKSFSLSLLNKSLLGLCHFCINNPWTCCYNSLWFYSFLFCKLRDP